MQSLAATRAKSPHKKSKFFLGILSAYISEAIAAYAVFINNTKEQSSSQNQPSKF